MKTATASAFALTLGVIGCILLIGGFGWDVYLQIQFWNLSEFALFLQHPLAVIGASLTVIAGFIMLIAASNIP